MTSQTHNEKTQDTICVVAGIAAGVGFCILAVALITTTVITIIWGATHHPTITAGLIVGALITVFTGAISATLLSLITGASWYFIAEPVTRLCRERKGLPHNPSQIDHKQARNNCLIGTTTGLILAIVAVAIFNGLYTSPPTDPINAWLLSAVLMGPVWGAAIGITWTINFLKE